jgi:hypothetical protein
MDGHDRVAGLDQRLDDQARGALNGNWDGRGRGNLVQAAAQFGQPFGGVVDGKTGDDVAVGVVDDADGMDAATPVHSATIAHTQSPVFCHGVPSAGRSCGKLIDRRSGLYSVARHPVARWDLPAPVTRRVSCGPKTGELTRPSWQASGRESIAP